MDSIKYLVLVVWLLSSLRETLGLSYFWQLKEYRMDRMRDYLTTIKGQKLFFSFTNLLRILLLVALVSGILVFESVVLLGVFAVVFLAYAKVKKKLFRPKFTFRALVLVGCVYFWEILILLYFKATIESVIIIEIIRPLLLTLNVFLIGYPFLIAKNYIIKKAGHKVDQLKDITIVGITGSYGKSSTKEFLYEILKTKFKVVKTPSNINTDIGVARTVLKNLKSTTEVFIVEMGAYKIGEIHDICNITKPKIGILTGINEQHLSLFGSMKNTIRAKSELLADLPKDGIAIVNWDNFYCHEAHEYSNADKTIKYSMNSNTEARASEVIQDGGKLKFTAYLGEENIYMTANILGRHYAQNLMAAIICAHQLGMSLTAIKEAVRGLHGMDHGLKLSKGKHGIKILDDSYNSNPDGFIAALKVAERMESNRVILVTMGMLELGKESDTLHRKVAKYAKHICDKIYVTSPDIQKYFKNSRLIEDHTQIKIALEKDLQEGDLILFENRIDPSVINYFKR